MKIQAKLTIRNGDLIEARKSMGLSQRKAAEKAGIKPYFLMRLETLNFPNIAADDKRLIKLCAFLKLAPEDLFPEELAGQAIQNKFISTQKVSPENLLAFRDAYNSRMLLSSPAEEAIKTDAIELIKKFMNVLTWQEREVITMLYGLKDDDEFSIEETGRILRISETRVYQVKLEALRKITKVKEARETNKERYKRLMK